MLAYLGVALMASDVPNNSGQRPRVAVMFYRLQVAWMALQRHLSSLSVLCCCASWPLCLITCTPQVRPRMGCTPQHSLQHAGILLHAVWTQQGASTDTPTCLMSAGASQDCLCIIACSAEAVVVLACQLLGNLAQAGTDAQTALAGCGALHALSNLVEMPKLPTVVSALPRNPLPMRTCIQLLYNHLVYLCMAVGA